MVEKKICRQYPGQKVTARGGGEHFWKNKMIEKFTDSSWRLVWLNTLVLVSQYKKRNIGDFQAFVPESWMSLSISQDELVTEV